MGDFYKELLYKLRMAKRAMMGKTYDPELVKAAVGLPYDASAAPPAQGRGLKDILLSTASAPMNGGGGGQASAMERLYRESQMRPPTRQILPNGDEAVYDDKGNWMFTVQNPDAHGFTTSRRNAQGNDEVYDDAGQWIATVLNNQ